MGYRPFRVTIGGVSIEGQTHGYMPDGLYIDWNIGVQGWFGTPDIKTRLTERELGDGSFSVDDGSVTYSSRTVAIGVMAAGRTSDDVAALRRKLLALSHRIVRISVLDGDEETYSEGYVSVEWGQVRRTKAQTGTLTIVCPDPRRYGSAAKSATLVPGGNASGGLDLTDARLAFPLAWGDQAASHSVATMHNAGTSTSYPTISIQGAISDVALVDTSGGRELTMPGYIGWQPIVLDCLSRTASIAGVDVTRRLGQRNFPSIPAGGDTTIALMCEGTNGTVHVEWRDTYI